MITSTRGRLRVAIAAGAGVAVAAGALLGSCSRPAPPPSGPSAGTASASASASASAEPTTVNPATVTPSAAATPTATPPETASPAADVVVAAHITAVTGDPVIVPSAETTVTDVDAGTVRLVTALPSSATASRPAELAYDVEVPAGALVHQISDSVIITSPGADGSDDESLVVAFAPPDTAFTELVLDASGAGEILDQAPPDAVTGGSWRVSDPGGDSSRTVRVSTQVTPSDVAASPDGAAVAGALLGTGVLVGASWHETAAEGGLSLAVSPALWTRLTPGASGIVGRSALAAFDPAAATEVMDKQLRCHALGAPTKATWNLEPWRPDVSYLSYLAAACNPEAS